MKLIFKACNTREKLPKFFDDTKVESCYCRLTRRHHLIPFQVVPPPFYSQIIKYVFRRLCALHRAFVIVVGGKHHVLFRHPADADCTSLAVSTDRKEVKAMGNSDKDFEKSNQCAFDAYCKVILRNEARDAYDQRKRKLKREQLFGEMSPEELNKLITTDRYFQFERDIVEDGLHFIVCDQGVYDALMTLPGAKRKIVLLSYFGEMNDREIGDALGTGRANVQYHRSRALAMMRKTLEQESEEY